jgi:hypothetical protein
MLQICCLGMNERLWKMAVGNLNSVVFVTGDSGYHTRFAHIM